MQEGRKVDKQTDRGTDRQMYKYIQTNRNKDVLTYTDMHRQKERQTDVYSCVK